MTHNETRTGYASVNGLQLYYEVHGGGEPLVLLHGGVVGIPMLQPILPELARTRQVIAVELRGHGRSAGTQGALSFDDMADDVAELLRQLSIEQADVMGYSLGSEVAQRIVIRHPALVRRLVLVSAACKHTGWYPEVLVGFEQLGPAAAEPMKQSPLSQVFPDLDWAVLFTRLHDLMTRDYDWTGDIAKITSPTLLVFADADAVTLTHIAEFFGLLGGGQRDAGLDGTARTKHQLAILPGTSHYDIIASPALAATVVPFLEASSAPGA